MISTSNARPVANVGHRFPCAPFVRGRAAAACAAPLAAVLAAAAFAGGCGSRPRPDLTPEEFTERSARERRALAEIQFAAADTLVKRGGTADPGERRPTLDLLAISGGGDWGAFGAGWIDERGLLFFLPSNPSFLTIPGLQADIERTADRAFVDRLATECRAGRTLIVSATDIDLGRQRFWNLGEEACRADDEGSERVHSMMLASSAIPVVFPPIEIDDGLFVDGGITANVLVRLDTRNPRGFLRRWKAEHPGEPFPRIRYWIIFNNQLSHIPAIVQQRWPGVLSPTMETVIRSATITQLDLLATEADYANDVFGADVEMRVVAIPDSWRPPVSGAFKEETMRELSDLGREMGRNPASWQVWAAPGRTGPLPPHAQ